MTRPCYDNKKMIHFVWFDNHFPFATSKVRLDDVPTVGEIWAVTNGFL